jgi:hypothetical protein
MESLTVGSLVFSKMTRGGLQMQAWEGNFPQ